MTIATTNRLQSLSAVSARKHIEPDEAAPGSLSRNLILPRELLSVAGLDLQLSEVQWEQLAREEMASITDAGIRFEAILMAGFAYELAYRSELLDPRVTYLLHELGEETRHSRLFLRLLEQLAPSARNPFTHGLVAKLDAFVTRRALHANALFIVFVLAGEEIPDLLQKRFSEHPDTDPFLAQVSRYHRAEEARHLAFARLLLPETWEKAGAVERFVVRHIAPMIVTGLFDSLVHPGVYETVGLPGWKTWQSVRRLPQHIELREQATRPICRALLEAGVFGTKKSEIPRSWQKLCGVGRRGSPAGTRSLL
jgi:P-aminobenzoate N-oxygenase AurF